MKVRSSGEKVWKCYLKPEQADCTEKMVWGVGRVLIQELMQYLKLQ